MSSYNHINPKPVAGYNAKWNKCHEGHWVIIERVVSTVPFGVQGLCPTPISALWNGHYGDPNWRTQQLYPSTTFVRGRLVLSARALFSFEDEEFPSLLYVYQSSLLLRTSNLVRESSVQLQSKGNPAMSFAGTRWRSPHRVLEPTLPFQIQVWLPLPTHMPMAFWICLIQKDQQPKLNGSTERSRACISNS